MKKILFAAAAAIALTAAGARAEDGIELKIGGDLAVQGGIVDNSATVNQADIDLRTDAELYFEVNGKGDGFTYGALVTQLANPNSLETDEVYLWIEAAFGRIEMGDKDGAGDALMHRAPTVGTGQVDGDIYYWTQDVGGIAALLTTYDSDVSTKLTYFTPVISGFQAGVSYAPEMASLGENVIRTNLALLAPAPGAPFMVGYTNTQQHIIELAAKFENALDNGLGYGVSAGYTTSNVKGGAGVGHIDSWGIGGQVTYQGFTLGGDYVDNNDSDIAVGSEWDLWELGLTYETDAWGLGISTEQNEMDGPGAIGTTEVDIYGLGGFYNLAPGLAIEADINWFERDVPAPGLDDDGKMFILTTRLSF